MKVEEEYQACHEDDIMRLKLTDRLMGEMRRRISDILVEDRGSGVSEQQMYGIGRRLRKVSKDISTLAGSVGLRRRSDFDVTLGESGEAQGEGSDSESNESGLVA
jgi:hypothetical protein